MELIESSQSIAIIILLPAPNNPKFDSSVKHSSVLELRKNQFLKKKINVLKTFLKIETTYYLEGLYLKLNNETYAKVLNL